jgi:hypothetical protein
LRISLETVGRLDDEADMSASLRREIELNENTAGGN